MSKENLKQTAGLPAVLAVQAETFWQRYRQALADAGMQEPADPLLCRMLRQVFALSEFVADVCASAPRLFDDLCRSGDLFRDYTYGEQLRALAVQLVDLEDEKLLHQRLRQYRQREMLRIAFRDLAGWNALQQTMCELSWLAEACLETTLGVLSRWQQKELGRPCNKQGKTQSLIILGMGKLGAGELNFSSDIDLMFAYPEEGGTRGGRSRLENSEYFMRLGRRLIDALNRYSEDGFVFRVDMRLRPFGDSGPLAMSFAAFEDYYQTHGREWERYAMIKARVVGGDRDAGEQLLASLKPFIYRRYIDFGVFASLRGMKQLIEREVLRKGMADNIKLGAGGIREIEFIGQAFQLIHGGQRHALQQRPILVVLQYLAQENLIPDYVEAELRLAYIFLRNTEHRLQMWKDEQTHLLPVTDEARQRLAFSMGCVDWQVFSAQLAEHRFRVDSHFRQIFVAPQADTHNEQNSHGALQALWQDSLDKEQAIDLLATVGYRDAEEILRRLAQLRDSYTCRALSAHGRERMDRLMPLLLGAAGGMDDADSALARLLRLIEQIARRTAYLALLIENPLALSQLVKLCSASPWITEQLSSHPILLDELLDARSLYSLPDQPQLISELETRLQGVDADDLERQMDTLRQFRHANTLRVAAADVNAAMPLMAVSNHLTSIAEVILDRVLTIAWRTMQQRHGQPPHPGFAIIAYGKLGGVELGYGSDLDLVFLHAGSSEDMSNGKQPLAAAVFFARLAQRITHILSTQTMAGILYEIDLRLRPSGASGLLVSTLSAFRDYQQSDAWIWEHQALVRARVVAGERQLADEFARVRASVLTRQVDLGELADEVRKMRRRMREQLGSKNSGEFDLKQDVGGIVDIEFMVQYAVLRWAAKHPRLLKWTDNIRLIETLVACGLLADADGRQLADVYRRYRAEVHRLTLQERPARVSTERFVAERECVQQLWQHWLGTDNNE